MPKNNSIFDKSSYGNFLSKSVTNKFYPYTTVCWYVTREEWQSIVLDSLLKCKDCKSVANINNVIDEVIEIFDELKFGYEDIDYKILNSRREDLKEVLKYDSDEYYGVLDKVSKVSCEYRDMEINYLIHIISEYMTYLDEKGFIKLYCKDSSTYLDYNLKLTDKFFQTYKNNHFINLNRELLVDLGTLVESRWNHLNSILNIKRIDSSALFAVIHRLRDLSDYFKSERMVLKNRDRVASYTFSEWIIYSLQVHQFVKLLFDNLNYSHEFDDMNKVFDYLSLENQTDSSYMRYIRSLAVVHPDVTDRHSGNGFHAFGEKEHSPYMDPIGPAKDLELSCGKPKPGPGCRYKFMNPDWETYNIKESFFITVYSSGKKSDELDLPKIIAISPLEVKQFTENSFNQLDHLRKLLILDNTRDGLDDTVEYY